jgi:hypothetical protein
MDSVFNRTALKLAPLSTRRHLLDTNAIMPLEYKGTPHQNLSEVAQRMYDAKKIGASIVLMMGAHVLRAGVQRFIVDLMQKGLISCVAMNGAGVIHDYEFSLIGATTESVADYIPTGKFGFWSETARINDIVTFAARKGEGLGVAVGRVIEKERFAHRDFSVLSAGYRLGIPVTVHVGIGCDIVHQFPNCDGAAYGQTSYTDFLRFARILEGLEGGVVMNFGSAVMAPEIYLKALSMVRNVAWRQRREIRRFTTLVCDLVSLPQDIHTEADPADSGYFFRPWKTMLIRTVKEGGRSYYVQGHHQETIPQLWVATQKETTGG